MRSMSAQNFIVIHLAVGEVFKFEPKYCHFLSEQKISFLIKIHLRRRFKKDVTDKPGCHLEHKGPAQ